MKNRQQTFFSSSLCSRGAVGKRAPEISGLRRTFNEMLICSETMFRAARQAAAPSLFCCHYCCTALVVHSNFLHTRYLVYDDPV